jgi:signal transduction histidine kinase
VDRSRQWFKSEVGVSLRQTPLEVSICAQALLENEFLVVPDLQLDDRFKNNPLCTREPNFRFYAGALLRSPEGVALGTLCVMDQQPRELSAEQLDALRALSRQVMTQLELRRLLAAKAAALEAEQKADEEVRAALSLANSAAKAKDYFLAMLSHELRTPLAPAMMTASAMATDESLAEHIREDAQLIARNLELEMRLIDDLLDVTRIVAGKLRLRLERLDVHALINNCIAVCRADPSARDIAIELDLRAENHEVTADAAKLQQVLWNLLKNAIKFTPAPGKITVSTSSDSAGDLAGDCGGNLRITVADTGIGIDPEMLPRLFTPFEQGSAFVTEQFGGLGLGLTICKGIVAAHGGKISAVSAGKDRGTAVTVELASAQMPAQVPAAFPSQELCEGPRSQLSILLVEDHEDTRRAMKRLLGRLNHRVITANCVNEALHAAKAETFDLVISDLGLPDGTGLDLMRKLLEDQPIPGIALTGYAMEADIEDAFAAGFARHLTKPINFSDLEEAIRSLMPAS